MFFAFTFSVLTLAVPISTWKFANETCSSPFFVFLWKSKPDFYGSLSRTKKKTSKLSLFRSKYWRSANSIIESRNPNQMETNEEAEKGFKSLCVSFFERNKSFTWCYFMNPKHDNNMENFYVLFLWNSFSNFFTTQPFSRSVWSCWNRKFLFSFPIPVSSPKKNFSCPLSLRLHSQNAFELRSWVESMGGGKKINIKFYLRCEANVRKINMVCRVRGWASFQFSIHNPLTQKQQLKKKNFHENRYKIYICLNLCK